MFFDYNIAKETYTDGFCDVFGVSKDANGIPDMSTIQFGKAIDNTVSSLDDNVVFLLSTGVNDWYRRKGLARTLLELVLHRYQDFAVVSDVLNGKSLPMYIENGFGITELESNYYLAVRKKRQWKHGESM